jgi:predicted homoserine dehydrogenase-like protein
MIIIDKALEKLEKENKPIRVGMIGAGFMAQGIADQIINHTKGMEIIAISNRTLSKAAAVLEYSGIKEYEEVSNEKELADAIAIDRIAITSDALLLIKNPNIDVIVEVTGSIDYGAFIAIEAIKNKKHLVTMSAELDGTVGPLLKMKADEAGIVYTVADGDQPGVTQNLISFVKGLGVKPVLCGNIKGLHDPYRNPTTQEAFAKKWGQNPAMVTSFADGSKISFEQTVTANANGMRVGKRGMYGPVVENGTSVMEAVKWYPSDKLLEGNGIVDYVVGAVPAPGVFVLGTTEDPKQKHYLNLYKLGEGPFYCFYVPYHLCHFEVPSSIARAVIFKDATLAPLDKPYVEVITAAKKDLKKGETIDGIGEYMTYGLCENSDKAREQNLLPLGLAAGAILKRDVSKDDIITMDDVEIDNEKISYKLWLEQSKIF